MQNFKLKLPAELKESHASELYRTYAAFYDRPATMRMVEVETGILRPNICRYVAYLEATGLIQKVRIGYCPFTRHRAGFYSTNPFIYNRIQAVSQLNLEFNS
jgi:hypothetical protein